MIVAEPLDSTLFVQFGTVLDSKDQLNGAVSANSGTAVKKIDACLLANDNPKATPKLNLFQCQPHPNVVANDLGYTFTGFELEKHPHSTQTFVPLARSPEAAYLVVVALGQDQPDLQTLSAFVCNGNQAVTYGLGVWHAPMIALFETTDFAVFISESGVNEEDCLVKKVDYEVEFGTEPPKKVRSEQTNEDFATQLAKYKGPPSGTIKDTKLQIGDDKYKHKQMKYHAEQLYYRKQYLEAVTHCDEYIPQLHPKQAAELEEIKVRALKHI